MSDTEERLEFRETGRDDWPFEIFADGDFHVEMSEQEARQLITQMIVVLNRSDNGRGDGDA